MIQTTLIPENTTISITIPKSYVGKKVHALFYVDEEIMENYAPIVSDKSIKVSPLVESLTGVIPDDSEVKNDYDSYLTNKYL